MGRWFSLVQMFIVMIPCTLWSAHLPFLIHIPYTEIIIGSLLSYDDSDTETSFKKGDDVMGIVPRSFFLRKGRKCKGG